MTPTKIMTSQHLEAKTDEGKDFFTALYVQLMGPILESQPVFLLLSFQRGFGFIRGWHVFSLPNKNISLSCGFLDMAPLPHLTSAPNPWFFSLSKPLILQSIEVLALDILPFRKHLYFFWKKGLKTYVSDICFVFNSVFLKRYPYQSLSSSLFCFSHQFRDKNACFFSHLQKTFSQGPYKVGPLPVMRGYDSPY